MLTGATADAGAHPEFEAVWRLARQTCGGGDRALGLRRVQRVMGVPVDLEALDSLQDSAAEADTLLAAHAGSIAGGSAAAAETDGQYQQLLDASTVVATELERAETHLAAARDHVLRGLVGEEIAADFVAQAAELLAEVERLTH